MFEASERGQLDRYGGQPDDPARKIGNTTRQAFWGVVVGMSGTLHRIEEVAADQNFGVDAGVAPEGVDRVELEEARQAMREVLAGLLEFLDRAAEL